MDINAWITEQFTPARVARGVDGGSGLQRRGGRGSFVQVLAWRLGIWCITHGGLEGGARITVYIQVFFLHHEDGDFEADIRAWSNGVRRHTPPRGCRSTVVFSPTENAPRKLNREIRRLRAALTEAD